jgi:DNA polymerase elongation subunit (family B)
MENKQYISVDQNFDKILCSYYKDGIKKYQTFSNRDGEYLFNDLFVKVEDFNHIYQTIETEMSLQNNRFNIQNDENIYKDIKGVELRRLKIPFEKTNFIKNAIPNYDFFGDISFDKKFINKYFQQRECKNFKVAFFDIETEVHANSRIQDYDEKIKVITVIFKDIINKKSNAYTIELGNSGYSKEGYNFIHCNDEAELLREFIRVFSREKPDCITGWNSQFFDIPYIIKRGEKILSQYDMNKLSPFKVIKEKKINNAFGREETTYDIIGIPHLDYMEVYKKHTYVMRDNYKLDNICNLELGAKKIDIEPYGGFKGIWKDHFDKYTEYNIRDVELLVELDNKLNLLSLITTLTYMTGCNFADTFFPVRTWDTYLFNLLKEKQIIIPQRLKHEKQHYMGAYVKQPKEPGVYDWIASFDLNSLYPNIMRQLNMSPETIKDDVFEEFRYSDVEQNIQNLIHDKTDLSNIPHGVSPKGIYFDNTKIGFIPKVIGDIYNNRRKAKNEMLAEEQNLVNLKKDNADSNDIQTSEYEISRLNNTQMALKILMNSLYGAFGSRFFRYFDLRIGESITSTGQLMNRLVENNVNELLNNKLETEDIDYVILMDTDSNYINLGPYCEKYGISDADTLQDTIINEIEGKIVEWYDEIFNRMKHFENHMVMKREVIANKGVFYLKKKRYALSVIDDEGVRYTKPKIKIVGLAIKSSSTPNALRDDLKEVINILLYKDNPALIEHIKKSKEKFMKLDYQDVCKTVSINNITKYTEWKGNNMQGMKGTPFNSRGAINFNNYIRMNNVDMNPISENGKYHICYLKPINPLFGQQVVIAFDDKLPEELVPYIDWEMLFQKAFLDVVHVLIDELGWDTVIRYGFDDLF